MSNLAIDGIKYHPGKGISMSPLLYVTGFEVNKASNPEKTTKHNCYSSRD